jgi:hypothetical protein
MLNGTVRANALTLRSSDHTLLFRGKVLVHINKVEKPAPARPDPTAPVVPAPAGPAGAPPEAAAPAAVTTAAAKPEAPQ